MSENDKKDFEFIKEQVIEKKRRKLRKKLVPVLMTVFLAILFGVIAAVTFVITEPRLYELLHKDEETKTPVAFPTEYPVEADVTPVEEDPETQNLDNSSSETSEEVEPETVFIEQSIDADIDDFSSMYNELRKVSYEANKSLVKVISITNEDDVLFGGQLELAAQTTGLVVHNNSVDLLILVSLDRVQEADSIKIAFTDAASAEAVIQDYDSETNLAVLAVPLKDIPSAYLSTLQVATLGESYTITVGSPILALGSPNGHTGSMEVGIISSKDSWIYITDYKLDLFNTDTMCNDDGDGVIVDMKGEVIGVITRTLKDELSEDLNTVIGISKLKAILAGMINQDTRIYFGIKSMDMTSAAKEEYKITNGIYITDVLEDSPAFEAGIKNGDIILQVNDQTIINTNNFYNAISVYRPEEEITIKIKRATGSSLKEMELTVILEEKKR